MRFVRLLVPARIVFDTAPPDAPGSHDLRLERTCCPDALARREAALLRDLAALLAAVTGPTPTGPTPTGPTPTGPTPGQEPRNAALAREEPGRRQKGQPGIGQ